MGVPTKMYRNALAAPTKCIEVSFPENAKVRLITFEKNVLHHLTREFEKRAASGCWCGYALLDDLPQDLPHAVQLAKFRTHGPICAVIFLRNSEARNFLFQSPELGFVLLDEHYKLLHRGQSLSETLDRTQFRGIRH
jgi:hypothetical protein